MTQSPEGYTRQGFRDVPLVGVPIQLRYRVSFVEMYVLPRAGKPTMITIVGELVNWGMDAGREAESQKLIFQLTNLLASNQTYRFRKIIFPPIKIKELENFRLSFDLIK